MKSYNFKEVFELADTYTGTSGISTFAGKLWKTKVVQFGEALRRFDQGCSVYSDLVGNGATVLCVPYTTSHKSVDTSTDTQDSGTVVERAHTALDNMTGVNLTVSASSFKQGDVTVTKAAEMSSMVNLVGQARYVVAQALAQDVDTAIATAFQATTITNRVYGTSGATDPSALATGGKMTPSLVADAMEKIEANNFVPDLLYIGTKQLRELRKDSQFTNAAEYGSDRVILKGEVGEYLGVKVIVTTNTPAYTSGDTDVNQPTKTWGATGHMCIMTGTTKDGQKASGALAWKEMPSISYEFEKRKNLHHIFYDQAYATGIIQPGATCLIKVSND